MTSAIPTALFTIQSFVFYHLVLLVFSLDYFFGRLNWGIPHTYCCLLPSSVVGWLGRVSLGCETCLCLGEYVILLPILAKDYIFHLFFFHAAALAYAGSSLASAGEALEETEWGAQS